MKKIILISLLATLALAPAVHAGREWTVEPAFPSVGSNPLEPGGFTNPYVIRETTRGTFEMGYDFPAPGRNVLEPGGPMNPMVITPSQPVTPNQYQPYRWR